MAPRYERPAAPVADAWPSGAAYDPAQASEKTAADLPWREFIRDEKLQKVIDQALANNRDLRSSLAANIQAARAQYRIQRSDLFPKFNGETERDPPEELELVRQHERRPWRTSSTRPASA